MQYTILTNDCENQLINASLDGIKLGFMATMIFVVLAKMFDWCQDPLAEKYKERIKELEGLNDAVLVENERLEAHLEKVKRSLYNIRGILSVHEELDSDDDTESQPSACKRRRVSSD